MKGIETIKIKKIDRIATERYGIPALILMENAGREVAREIRKFKHLKNVLFFCGRGNNGGDGFVAIRHLLDEKRIEVILIGKKEEVKEPAKTNIQALLRMGVKINEIINEVDLKNIRRKINSFDIIVDALLGTGIKGEVKGVYKSAIELINQCKKKVIAVDIPSGLDADTGKRLGVCVKANITVTMGVTKKGFYLHEGKLLSGEIKVADLGIPKRIINEVEEQ